MFKTYPTLIIIYIICFVVFGFVLKLFIYHMKIICIGQSTYENLKGHFKNTLFNPYHFSCTNSMYRILLKKRSQEYYKLYEMETARLEYNQVEPGEVTKKVVEKRPDQFITLTSQAPSDYDLPKSK